MMTFRTSSATFHRCIAVLIILCLVAACAMPAFMRSGKESALSSPDTFTVLTYNAWHGLDVGRFWVYHGESNDQHEARFKLRIQHLAQARPDLILLQEVNPLPQMADDYVQALKKLGLHYSEVHQVDACAIRVPGVALLPELNNGLVILAKEPLHLRKLDGLKLSGGIGGCHDTWGIQFGELRYALIAEVTAPSSRLRYLVATAHLHSGIEHDAYFLHDLMEAHQQGRLMHYDQLMAELVQDQDRRLKELHALVEALQAYQANQDYAGVIVGGTSISNRNRPNTEY